MKYDISDIPPTSAIKIFTFLDKLLEEENLNPDYFRENGGSFSFQERYFLYLYASIYFSDKPDSFLNQWIGKVIADYGIDLVSDRMTIIVNNAKALRKITNLQKLKALEKEFQNYNQTKEDEAKYALERTIPIFENNPEEFRAFQKIPLYVSNKRINEFRKFFFENFEESLDLESLEKLFLNTFEFGRNITDLQLLYLSIDQKAIFEQALMNLNRYYKINILDHMKDQYIDKINAKIEKQILTASTIRKRFLPKKLKYTIVTRLHFMKAMYNSFPYIRNAYQKALINNPSLQIDNFLNQKIKNFKSA